jgi:hypothetical protein
VIAVTEAQEDHVRVDLVGGAAAFGLPVRNGSMSTRSPRP